MRSRLAVVVATGLLVGGLATSSAVLADEINDSVQTAALGEVVASSVGFAVIEHATTDVVIDVGEVGDTVGDMLAFGNDLYDAENASVVGRDQGQCFRSNPGRSWECTWTNYLADGSLTVQGPFYDDLSDSVFAITGGTGVYASAAGSMTLHARDELGSELDFIFDVRLDPAYVER